MKSFILLLLLPIICSAQSVFEPISLTSNNGVVMTVKPVEITAATPFSSADNLFNSQEILLYDSDVSRLIQLVLDRANNSNGSAADENIPTFFDLKDLPIDLRKAYKQVHCVNVGGIPEGQFYTEALSLLLEALQISQSSISVEAFQVKLGSQFETVNADRVINTADRSPDYSFVNNEFKIKDISLNTLMELLTDTYEVVISYEEMEEDNTIEGLLNKFKTNQQFSHLTFLEIAFPYESYFETLSNYLMATYQIEFTALGEQQAYKFSAIP